MNLEELISEVLKRRARPEDKLEVAATLESIGWNDKMANDHFGVRDVFELADDCWAAMQNKILFAPAAKVEKLGPVQYFIKVVRSFLRGTIFAWPMAISIAAMLTLRFSLWSYENLSLRDATSISIGTLFSFMVVGGFTQAIARRGFLYVGQGHYQIARRVTYQFVRLGAYVSLGVAFLFILVSRLFIIYPWDMTFIIVLYFLFLSGIWLSVTVMYMLQKELAFTGLITAGIGLVYILFRIVKLDIIVSQIIAVAIVTVASIILAIYFFLKAEMQMEKGIAPVLPRFSILLYTSLPYFIYGFAYFAFLGIDRLIAWSTNSIYMPYIVWFRGEYELGLDFALLVLIVPMGLLEVVVNEIMANLLADQKNYQGSDTQAMNRQYLRFYRKRFLLVALLVAVNAVALYYAVKLLNPMDIVRADVFSNPVTYFVFVLAIVGYAILAMGLMNSLILFSLAQPKLVYVPMLYGLVTNVFTGFLLSRWVDYSYAVIGLVTGAVVFLFLTTRNVRRVLTNLDYYLYAAL